MTVRSLCVYAVLLVVTLPGAGKAVAADFKLLPSLTVRQEYNDNIFFSVRDTLPDSITTLSPGLELVSKTERVDFSLLSRIDERLYWKQSDLNATDQTYKGSLGYAVSPKFRVSGRAAYIQDSSPDRDIETTGLVLSNVRRDRRVYGVNGEYTLSQRTLATLAYDYDKDDYQSPRFSDMESNAASLGFIHDLTPMTKLRSNLGFDRYSFTGSQVDNFTGTVGLIRQHSELWSASADAGLRYTRSKTIVTSIPASQTEKSQDTGWIAQVALTYKGEKTNAAINLSHDLLPASGNSGATERTAVSLNVSRRLTYELRGTFYASYFLNKAEKGQFSAQTIDQQSLSINPGVRYELTRDVAIEASYSFVLVRYRDTNEEADRNLFMVRLILQHALFE